MVITRFPEIESVSAVLSGDVEQVRDSLNPMLMPGGKVDLHCRGDNSVEDMMTVSLPLSGTTTPYYAGIIKFPDIPVSISQVTYNRQIVAWQLVSVASTEYPGLSGSFSKHEEFFLRVDAEGIQGKIVGDTLMADFEITWTIDPSLTAVSEWIQAEENHVAGIDLLPRWFIPYHVNHLDVWYNRKSGVVFNRLQAREELLNRFNTHHPGSPAGSHTVGDTLYWAGAHSLHRIEFEAELRPSLATYWHPGDLVHPQSDADWEAFDLELTPVPTRTVTDLVNFTPDFIDLDSGVSVAGRNFSWRLPSANLRLIERESI